MTNEVPCKILAHNICCLIQEQCELGIETEFWTEKPVMPAMPAIEREPVADAAELAFV